MEKKRILLVYSLFVVLLCVVAGCIIYRIFYISVDKGNWAEYGERRLHVIDTIPAERGNIYDCNGKLLSSTLPQYTFHLDFGSLDKYTWPDSKKKKMRDAFNYYLDSLALCLSNEFKDKTKEQYIRYLQAGANKKSGYYPLARKVSFLQMMQLKDFPYLRIGIKEDRKAGYPVYRSNLSGLIPFVEAIRVKPYESLADKMIGNFTSENGVEKKYGLENMCDSLLRGTPGLGRYIYASVSNSKGRNEPKELAMTIKEPKSGEDIVSAIDIGMQEIAQNALYKQVVQTNARMGMIALMEVKTGEVKAVASFQRNLDGRYKEYRNELLSLAFWEPGSTFKTASMMIALEDGVVSPDDPAMPGEGGVWNFRTGLKPIKDHNWRSGGFKSLTVPDVIHKSSNIGISKIILKGYGSNPQKYIDRLNEIGITKPMDLRIEGAKTPIVNNPETKYKADTTSLLKPWSETTLPWMSFGYEFYLPPIYTLNFYNAIANGGVMMKPIFVKGVMEGKKMKPETNPEVLTPKICSDGTLAIIKSMLEGVVLKGTGTKIQSKYVKIAGKTGTTVNHNNENFVNVSFCGYFPADNPKYTCYVILQDVSRTSSAGETAGAAFKSVAEQIYVSKMELPASAARDTLSPFFPAVKKGHLHNTEYVLNALNISYQHDNGKSEWITQTSGGNGVYLNNTYLSKTVIPNVVGMGIKDAVYVLEKTGLKVTRSGRGKVTQQSLPPGTDIRKGQSISIRLS